MYFFRGGFRPFVGVKGEAYKCWPNFRGKYVFYKDKNGQNMCVCFFGMEFDIRIKIQRTGMPKK